MDGSVQGCWDSSFSISTGSYYSSWYTRYSRYCWLGARLVKRAYLGRRRPRRVQTEWIYSRSALERFGLAGYSSSGSPWLSVGSLRLHVREERFLDTQCDPPIQP